MRTIEQIAKDNDAAVLTDSFGDIAIQRRLYDDNGVGQVRYRPDNCHFLPERQWLAMNDQDADRSVC